MHLGGDETPNGDSAYARRMNTHCEETYFEWLSQDNFYDAEKTCNEQPSCGGFMDTVCGDGFFELCKKGTRFITNTETTDLWVSDSCVWVKPGIYCSR